MNNLQKFVGSTLPSVKSWLQNMETNKQEKCITNLQRLPPTTVNKCDIGNMVTYVIKMLVTLQVGEVQIILF